MKAWYQTHQFVESVFFLHCSSPFLWKIRKFIALWTPEIFPILFKYSGGICGNGCPVPHFVQLSLWTPLLEHHNQSKNARGPLRVGMWLHISQRFLRDPGWSFLLKVNGQESRDKQQRRWSVSPQMLMLFKMMTYEIFVRNPQLCPCYLCSLGVPTPADSI